MKIMGFLYCFSMKNNPNDAKINKTQLNVISFKKGNNFNKYKSMVKFFDRNKGKNKNPTIIVKIINMRTINEE